MKIKKTEYRVVKLSDIKLNDENPRTILDEDREILVNSLVHFGNVGVLVLDKKMNLISGHQRYSVLEEFGETEAMCVIGDYTKAQGYELLTFLNTQLGTGKWDKGKLDSLMVNLRSDDDFNEARFEALGLDRFENTELSQYRDLKEFQGEYMPEQEGGSEQPDRPSGDGNPVYSHTIVFRDEPELNTFLSWLHNLREKYPLAETTSERILLELVGDERGEQ